MRGFRGVSFFFLLERHLAQVAGSLSVSEGFQRALKPCGFRGVSEGSETVWFQRGFKRDLKARGFRGVSEGSETVWSKRGFRVA